MRDHGGRKGTPSLFRVPAFPFPFPLHDRRLKGERKGEFGRVRSRGEKGNSLVLSRARIPFSLSPFLPAFLLNLLFLF